MSVKAFVDYGYKEPFLFCRQLLQSPEFAIGTLKKFPQKTIQKPTKQALAYDIAEAITRGRLDPTFVMCEYVKQSRQWTSFKIGKGATTNQLENANHLLTEFGAETWYGPIYIPDDQSNAYIRVFGFKDWSYTGSGETKRTQENKIRWVIIAKVRPSSYLSLYWNGFTINARDKIDSRTQFPFWQYIPEAFSELEEVLGGNYSYPAFHTLVLKIMWDRYISNPEYLWRHLAVRAEASGVALSARSAGVKEIDVRGLLALAHKLADSVVNTLNPFQRRNIQLDVFNPSSVKEIPREKIENAILRTLIHEWGTKSYEFSLEKQDKKIFRAHCYFGLKPNSNTQDCFPHFKTYQAYGGTFQTVDFLLREGGNAR